MTETAKIRQTLNAISSCLDSLKNNVDSISEFINSESIINSNVISDTMEELLKLKKFQDTLKKDYTDLFPEKKCSDLLNAIISEIDNFEIQLEEKKLIKKAKYIIIKFNSIRSDIEECQKYIDEYSSQLQEISNKDMKLEEYVKAVEPYEEFYKAVETGSTTDRIQFTEKETVFSDNTKLMLYLIQNKLYIDKSMLVNIDEFIATESNEPLQLSFDSDICRPVNTSVEETITEISKDEDLHSDTKDVSLVNEATETEENADVSEFLSFGISTSSINKYDNMSVEDNGSDKKITIKAFKKDLEKYQDGNGFLLYAFHKYSYVNDKLLKYAHKINNSELDFSPMIASLLKSGYIKKDVLGDFPAIYSLTTQTVSCLKEKTNADWFKRFNSITKNIWDFENTTVTKTKEESNQNRILTRIGYCEIKRFEAMFYPVGQVSTIMALSGNFYSEAKEYGKHKTSFYYFSCFLDEKSDINKLLTTIELHISQFSNPDIEFSLLASDNIKNCTSIMKYLKSKYSQFNNTRFYCFCTDNNSYYNMESSEEIQLEDFVKLASEYHKSKYKSAGKAKETVVENAEPESAKLPENIGDNPEINTVSETETSKEAIEKNEPEVAAILDEKSTLESIDTIADIIDEIVSDDEVPESADSVDYSFVYCNKNISEEEIMGTVYTMINSGKPYCASAYLGIISPEIKYANLKQELAFALNTPDKKGIYLSDVVMNIFDDFESIPGSFSECLKVCAEMRVLFYNTARHDYNYKQMYTVMKSLSPIESNSALADFSYNLEKFKTTNNIGIDAVADYRIQENITREKLINEISQEAASLYDRYVINPVRERCALPRYLDMKKMIFRENNTLSECLKIAADNSNDEIYLEYVRDFINSNFIDDNIDIKSDNFKSQTIDKYVDNFWIEAGKIQRDKQASSKLVSSLRNNILNSVSKIVSVICDWYYLSHNAMNTSSIKNYEKDKNIIKASLSEAISCVENKIAEYSNNAEMLAGYNCIRTTLSEFDSRLNGSYNETDIKYYYIDFLKYGDVILDENYIPEFKGHNIVINNFTPADCIINHSKRPDRSLDDRINEIFNRLPAASSEKMSDDYGCAELIKKYYNDYNIEWDDESNNIEANTAEAFEEFKRCFENFKGSLELSQSYGQIDNDRKEQMFAMVYIQFIKNENTHNYGYFSRIVSHVEETIRHEAKKREKSLRANLETVANESNDPEKTAFITEARKMLEIQNYTVAEDLIHRIQNNDLDNKDFTLEEDIFLDFINEYSSNYKLVSNSALNLKKIIQNSRRPMKDTKKGAVLIDNFPTGRNQNPDKIKNLLSTLGFPVDKVSVDNTAQKNYDSYSIELIKNTNGKKENYTHPIAPFGSLAEENGFRVICLFGMFDARRLLDKFKEIGTTRHTIVILDYALNMPERRTLARKIKEEISDKIFIVIDRVTIFYLANHYTENTINRVLMEVTLPFSSFQPYSTDSARPIPVEMFMGRKDQLEDIESPTGANIISGGRQLGKSALLRRAKSDIDNNENGDRAVYVEIKDCNCQRAAEKISAALVDEGIIPEGSETTEWKVLSRSIKKRLNSKTDKKIPYLLLLIDEADIFIEDCKKYNYEPLDDLEDIQSIGVNRFKFVVAGLRNLVKFEKEKSMANNSGIAHLSQKTIRPFTYTEACELLEKPLHYLGIRFPKDQSYLISLILANTNYFPGLIHFYCAKLIEAVKKYDPVFDETTSPPYEVNEDHIKRVLADPEFRKQIKDKFEITLKLDTDNFYHIIVVLMAYCHYTTVSSDGYSAEEIHKNASEYDISKIKELNIDQLAALMDELCELNILRKNKNGKYLFARYNFLQLLGSSGEIDEMILRYSEEEA